MKILVNSIHIYGSNWFIMKIHFIINLMVYIWYYKYLKILSIICQTWYTKTWHYFKIAFFLQRQWKQCSWSFQEFSIQAQVARCLPASVALSSSSCMYSAFFFLRGCIQLICFCKTRCFACHPNKAETTSCRPWCDGWGLEADKHRTGF
jgi:hypothetical protein